MDTDDKYHISAVALFMDYVILAIWLVLVYLSNKTPGVKWTLPHASSPWNVYMQMINKGGSHVYH